MMRLTDLLKGFDYTAFGRPEDVMIERICNDSRDVREGGLFVAIKGAANDGHKYVDEALGRGARAVVLEDETASSGAVMIKVSDTKEALAVTAKNFYGDPSKEMKVIGITGTNGKTTVSYLVESILKKAGFKVGLIGTIAYKTCAETIEAANTTPSSLALQGFMRKMADHHADYCVMEVSSHALDQKRVHCVDFDTAVFTNATPEHLDYHKDFRNYLESKKALFKALGRDKLAVINRDDPNFRTVMDSASSEKRLSFSVKAKNGADVYADRIRAGMEGVSFAMHYKKTAVFIESALIGVHNVSNILAASACALAEGIGWGDIKEGVESLKEIPGRLQLVESPRIRLFVDFAHTDDALEKALSCLNAFKTKRIITVFGCGGNRDKAKRPRMGNVSSRLSDYVIITSDNPRYEEPEEIAAQITSGIRPGFKDFRVILDRRKAIEEAVSTAADGDIVLVAGKGHEKYQVVKDKLLPFDDAEIAAEFLKAKTHV